MFGGGILGYALRLFGLPIAPLLIAFILTRPFEEALRQALIGSEDSLMVFVNRPIALFFLVLTALGVALVWRRNARRSSTE